MIIKNQNTNKWFSHEGEFPASLNPNLWVVVNPEEVLSLGLQMHKATIYEMLVRQPYISQFIPTMDELGKSNRTRRDEKAYAILKQYYEETYDRVYDPLNTYVKVIFCKMSVDHILYIGLRSPGLMIGKQGYHIDNVNILLNRAFREPVLIKLIEI